MSLAVGSEGVCGGVLGGDGMDWEDGGGGGGGALKSFPSTRFPDCKSIAVTPSFQFFLEELELFDTKVGCVSSLRQ